MGELELRQVITVIDFNESIKIVDDDEDGMYYVHWIGKAHKFLEQHDTDDGLNLMVRVVHRVRTLKGSLTIFLEPMEDLGLDGERR